jgi:hypothetical protein
MTFSPEIILIERYSSEGRLCHSDFSEIYLVTQLALNELRYSVHRSGSQDCLSYRWMFTGPTKEKLRDSANPIFIDKVVQFMMEAAQGLEEPYRGDKVWLMTQVEKYL